jgi:hypothetical protein
MLASTSNAAQAAGVAVEVRLELQRIPLCGVRRRSEGQSAEEKEKRAPQPRREGPPSTSL